MEKNRKEMENEGERESEQEEKSVWRYARMEVADKRFVKLKKQCRRERECVCVSKI